MPGYQQRYGMPPMNYRQGPNRYEEIDPNGEQFRKIFIGGLSFESDENSLKAYFSTWGEITDCVVMRDQVSKRSRGFGFITFKDKEVVNEVQRDRKHKVDGREVETKRAMPRDDPNANNQVTVNKMFLGGLKDDTTEEMIRSVFSEYGTIKEIELIPDKHSGKIKGFCFVTFDDYDAVDKCVLLRRILVNGRKVEVKKAYGKDEMRYKNMVMNMGPGGPMSGGRGGRGDYVGGYREYFPGMGYHPNGPGGMGNNFNWPSPSPYNDYFNHQGGNQRGGYNNYSHNHNQHYNNRR